MKRIYFFAGVLMAILCLNTAAYSQCSNPSAFGSVPAPTTPVPITITTCAFGGEYSTRGKAYGVELLIKKVAGKLNGWISYTYSRTLLKTDDLSAGEMINNGDYYPANYDKPHDLTFIGNFFDE